jgi:hypothetical protein
MQELVGSALFCLIPVGMAGGSMHTSTDNASKRGWNVSLLRYCNTNVQTIYASPSVKELLGQKPTELEGRDFFDLVYCGWCTLLS